MITGSSFSWSSLSKVGSFSKTALSRAKFGASSAGIRQNFATLVADPALSNALWGHLRVQPQQKRALDNITRSFLLFDDMANTNGHAAINGSEFISKLGISRQLFYRYFNNFEALFAFVSFSHTYLQYMSFMEHIHEFSLQYCAEFCHEWVYFMTDYSSAVIERYQDDDLAAYRSVHTINFSCHAYFAPQCAALLRARRLISPDAADLHVQIAMSSLAASIKAVRLRQGAAHLRQPMRDLLAEQMAHNLKALR